MEIEIPPEINLHGCADDHGIKDKFNLSDREPEKLVIDKLVDTTNEIKTWMDSTD